MHNCKSNGIDGLTLIYLLFIVALVIPLYFGGQFRYDTPMSHYKVHNRVQRIEKGIMVQSINNIATDRIYNHESRIPNTFKTQAVSQIEAKRAYDGLPSNTHRRYKVHILYTNDSTEHTPITKHLIKASRKVKGISYHSNITTISFGSKHYAKDTMHWHPWHRVKTSYGMSKMINKRMMQGQHNRHRNIILNKHNHSVGVTAYYNIKHNNGVLVETFRTKE